MKIFVQRAQQARQKKIFVAHCAQLTNKNNIETKHDSIVGHI
jgi:hypothetical protein